MALNKNFYEEIYDRELMWIDMIDSNLLNVYYLTELKNFYLEKQQRLNYEFELTGNSFMKSVSYIINNIVVKLDFLINEDKKEKIINLNELKNLFLINVMNNNIPILKNEKIDKIEENKKDLYELRKKVTGDGAEDYLDDDFYYDNQKVA